MGNGDTEVWGGSTPASRQKGWYLVRTDLWYVERVGWLVSGIFVLAMSVTSLLYGAKFAALILVCSFSSIVTAFSGFCPVGNIFHRFGMKALLGRNGGGPWYLMQTDSWYLERRIYLMVGVNLTIGSVLVMYHSPLWLLYTAFVGTACVVFALTGFCIMAHLLYRSGKEPRLSRQCC